MINYLAWFCISVYVSAQHFSVCMYVYKYICMYVWTYVCMYVWLWVLTAAMFTSIIRDNDLLGNRRLSVRLFLQNLPELVLLRFFWCVISEMFVFCIVDQFYKILCFLFSHESVSCCVVCSYVYFIYIYIYIYIFIYIYNFYMFAFYQ